MFRRPTGVAVALLAASLMTAGWSPSPPTPSESTPVSSATASPISEREARAAFDAYASRVQAMFDAEDADPALMSGAATARAAEAAAEDVQATLDAGFRQTIAPAVRVFVLVGGASSDAAEAEICLDASEAEIVDRSTGEPAERTTDPLTDWHVSFERVDTHLLVADYQSIGPDDSSPCDF